jgi:hypothetical protein
VILCALLGKRFGWQVGSVWDFFLGRNDRNNKNKKIYFVKYKEIKT